MSQSTCAFASANADGSSNTVFPCASSAVPSASLRARLLLLTVLTTGAPPGSPPGSPPGTPSGSVPVGGGGASVPCSLGSTPTTTPESFLREPSRDLPKSLLPTRAAMPPMAATGSAKPATDLRKPGPSQPERVLKLPAFW